jgi:hypothetical protein
MPPLIRNQSLSLAIVCILLSLSQPSGRAQALGSDCPRNGHKSGDFSQLAVSLCYQDSENDHRYLEIPSPDKSILLIVRDSEGTFYTKGQPIGDPFFVGRDEEFVWSPDSKALIRTTTLSATGPSSADVMYIRPNPFPEGHPITETLRRDFALRHPEKVCHANADVGGLTWIDGSREVVLVAQIPASPHCEPDDGYFDVYVVSIPAGDIVARYPMKDAGLQWRNILGSQLREYLKIQKDR